MGKNQFLPRYPRFSKSGFPKDTSGSRSESYTVFPKSACDGSIYPSRNVDKLCTKFNPGFPQGTTNKQHPFLFKKVLLETPWKNRLERPRDRINLEFLGRELTDIGT
jgi:hypothetical protein